MSSQMWPVSANTLTLSERIGELETEGIDTRAAISAAVIDLDVTLIRTGGYATVGDGGHGLYAAIPNPGSTNRRYLQSADGRWWGLVAPDGANAKQFGAKGNGSEAAADMTAETTALQQMLSSGIPLLFIPPGTYMVNSALTLSAAGSTVHGGGSRNTVIYAKSHINDVLMITANNCSLRHIQIAADIYESFGTYLLKPNSCLKWQASATTEIAGVTIDDVLTSGGNQGVWMTNPRDVNVRNLRIYKPYQYGLALSGGPRSCMVDELFVDGSGINEGVRIGSPNSNYPTENVTIKGFEIKSCGALDVSRANWQNNIGSHSNCLRNVQILNGIIEGGGPALEWKFNGDTAPPAGRSLTYRDVLVANVHVTTPWADQASAATRWNGAASVSTDAVGRIKFHNCSFIHDGTETPTSSACMAISLSGGDGNEIVDCTIKGFFQGLEVTGTGETGLTTGNRRTLVKSNNIDVIGTAIRIANSTIEKLKIINNVIVAGEGIVAGGNTGISGLLVAGNDVVSTTTASSTANAIDLRGVTSGTIYNNDLEADQRPLVITAQATNPTVAIEASGNRLKARNTGAMNYALVASEGAIEFNHNRVTLPTVMGRGYLEVGGTVTAFRNLRGLLSAAPTSTGGARGDYFGNSALTAGGVPEWHVTTASDSSATWKAAASVAA